MDIKNTYQMPRKTIIPKLLALPLSLHSQCQRDLSTIRTQGEVWKEKDGQR
jgi:hypothetical protein